MQDSWFTNSLPSPEHHFREILQQQTLRFLIYHLPPSQKPNFRGTYGRHAGRIKPQEVKELFDVFQPLSYSRLRLQYQVFVLSSAQTRLGELIGENWGFPNLEPGVCYVAVAATPRSCRRFLVQVWQEEEDSIPTIWVVTAKGKGKLGVNFSYPQELFSWATCYFLSVKYCYEVSRGVCPEKQKWNHLQKQPALQAKLWKVYTQVVKPWELQFGQPSTPPFQHRTDNFHMGKLDEEGKKHCFERRNGKQDRLTHFRVQDTILKPRRRGRFRNKM